VFCNDNALGYPASEIFVLSRRGFLAASIAVLADFSFTPPEQILAQLQSRQTPNMGNGGMAMPDMNAKPDLNDVTMHFSPTAAPSPIRKW
jgi:hypothetical protein